MLRVNLVALVAASATLAACSFFTKFEIEEVTSGGGGAGGSTSTMPTTTTMATNAGGGGGGVGGEGGGEMPPCEDCRNCYPSLEACPAPMDQIEIESVEMGTPSNQTRIVWTTDAVAVGTSYMVVGTFGAELAAPYGLAGNGNIQSGFLIRGDDALFTRGFGTCLANDTPNDDEVFMTSMTKLPNNNVVLGGGYEGVDLVSFQGVLDCAAPHIVDGPSTNEELVPFLVWWDPTDEISFAQLEPPVSGTSGTANGYIADVVYLTGSADRVAAVGIAEHDPFDANPGGGPTNYYVVTAVNGGPAHEFLQLDGVTCDIIQDSTSLWGLRSSIASDINGDAWVVAAGCGGDDGRSGLWKLDVAANGVLSEAESGSWGDAQNPFVATEIALSETQLVIAGSYQGTPSQSWIDTPGFEPGDDGDAFVMAFPLADGMGRWNNTTPPSWFRRIRSDGTSDVEATVEALIVADGAVWVAGKMAAEGGIGNNAGCFTTDALDGGRAYLAELDAGTGLVHFVKIDGFDTRGTAGDYPLAWGTALVHPPNQLIHAVSSMGNIKLDCLGGVPNDTNVPRSTVRRYSL
jgi:hypothetical protein